MDGSGDGPDIGVPVFDWASELSSRWNKEMILLLSREFLQRIKSGSELPLAFDASFMSEDQLMRFCTTKLRRTHAQNRNVGVKDSGKKKKTDDTATSRRNTRRQGVSVLVSHTCMSEVDMSFLDLHAKSANYQRE